MILEITLTAIASFTAGYVISKHKTRHIHTESATINGSRGAGASNGSVTIQSIESESTKLNGSKGSGADGEIKNE